MWVGRSTAGNGHVVRFEVFCGVRKVWEAGKDIKEPGFTAL